MSCSISLIWGDNNLANSFLNPLNGAKLLPKLAAHLDKAAGFPARTSLSGSKPAVNDLLVMFAERINPALFNINSSVGSSNVSKLSIRSAVKDSQSVNGPKPS